LIPASATTSATWTLPANFPPNMCVRITTSGGTVTQKGSAIAWDPHGYYQISLDAGEVTIK
ncbi:MAG TPA: polysaccharide deacetylase, partial [Polyangiaceae bacterium]|nr:polysaccharide deacetylase [Polyangiaceae bacterium]